MELIHRDESYAVMGACFEVYKEMGCGFLEAVYQECLELEFELQGIAFQSQPTVPLHYKQKRLLQVYQPDFICLDKIVLEIKSVADVTDVHRAQVHNYLCATGYESASSPTSTHTPNSNGKESFGSRSSWLFTPSYFLFRSFRVFRG